MIDENYYDLTGECIKPGDFVAFPGYDYITTKDGKRCYSVFSQKIAIAFPYYFKNGNKQATFPAFLIDRHLIHSSDFKLLLKFKYSLNHYRLKSSQIIKIDPHKLQIQPYFSTVLMNISKELKIIDKKLFRKDFVNYFQEIEAIIDLTNL